MKYRVIMDGKYRDKNNLKEALKYIEKNWKESTSDCNIRRFHPTKNLVRTLFGVPS